MKKWKPSLGRTSLKIIAVLTMLCDHIAFVLLRGQGEGSLYQYMRIIGRVSFPIFCFVLLQGFMTTKNMEKYIFRMLVFALLSEIPFDLAFSNCLLDWNKQNVMFTLFIGLLVLIGIRRYETDLMAVGGIILAGCLVAAVLKTDYSYFGVALIAVFYLFRNNILAQGLWAVILIAAEGGIEIYAAFALPICYLYQSEKKEKKLPKYFFYGFYPVHLLILYAIASLYAGCWQLV